MANYNKVILVGNLTRDPQLSYLPSQTPVCEFAMAVNRRWRGQEGEQREETCFIDCRLFGKQAETFNQYMSKGCPVLIEGRLQLDTWEAPSGRKYSKHQICVQSFQFLGVKGEEPSQEPAVEAPAPVQAPPAAEPPPRAPPQAPPPEEPEMFPDTAPGDDIPF